MSSEPPCPVRVVVVGTGLIGPRHADSIVRCSGTELACIVDPSPAAADVAEKFNVTLYRSCREMLESMPQESRPDAAIVCTPNQTHVVVAKELLEGGLDVLVEKPIAADVLGGRDLVDYAAKCERKLLVGHHRRFQPCMLAAQKAISEGSLGRIIAVNGLWTTYKAASYFEGEGAWRQNSTGGGVVLINMIHDVDLLQFMLGPIVRVTIEETTKQRSFAAEEGAAILFRFASGAVGTFILSDAVPSPHSFEQGTGENPAFPKSGQDVYRIFGSEATLSVPDMVRWSYDGKGEKSWNKMLTRTTLETSEATPFDLQVAHLVRVVRGEETPVCDGEAALSALIVCDAIRAALKTGTSVDIYHS